jgi:hypothetical protein
VRMSVVWLIMQCGAATPAHEKAIGFVVHRLIHAPTVCFQVSIVSFGSSPLYQRLDSVVHDPISHMSVWCGLRVVAEPRGLHQGGQP